jgi:hypothetical protein
MAVNELDNGNPLTYNWLNELVHELQTVSKDVKSFAGSARINLIPDHLSNRSSSNYVQMLTGSTVISLDKSGSVGKSLVNFSTPFAAPDVLIIPAINFPNNAEDIYATAWATNINESSCIIRLKRFTPLDKKQSTNITVNFIAIGKGKPTS